jgi:hypothetical protein
MQHWLEGRRLRAWELAQGAEGYGFRGRVWTHARVAAVIQEKMGVKYNPHHIPRYLNKIKWTRQKPRQRASQRNEAAIRRWCEVEWPKLLKQARASRQTIVFKDEAGPSVLIWSGTTSADKLV